MKFKVLLNCLLVLLFSSSTLFASGQENTKSEKPGIVDAVVTIVEATVEKVDHKNRMVTLKGPEGNLVELEVDEAVKNLPQVEKGDIVTVEYVEAVSIQVFPKGAAVPGLTAIGAEASAEPGEKPAGVAMEKITLVTVVDAIDLKQQLVTLKGAEGKTKTFKARNPERLAKVEVGDTVMITITKAIGISVTEKE